MLLRGFRLFQWKTLDVMTKHAPCRLLQSSDVSEPDHCIEVSHVDQQTDMQGVQHPEQRLLRKFGAVRRLHTIESRSMQYQDPQ